LCTLIGITANAAEAGCLQAPGALRAALLDGAALCLASTPEAIEALTFGLTHPGLMPPPKGGTRLKIVRSGEDEKKAA
jgi:hypothetical protein